MGYLHLLQVFRSWEILSLVGNKPLVGGKYPIQRACSLESLGQLVDPLNSGGLL